MRAVRRLLLGICKLALLSCVGVPVYSYIRNTPRCTVDGLVSLGGLSTDGRTLLISDFSAQHLKEAAGERVGRNEPVQIRLHDTSSGRRVQSFDQVTDFFTAYCRSSHCQYFALQTGRDVVLLDLAGRTHTTLVNCDDPSFSDYGKWLHVRHDNAVALVCTKTGRIARRLTGKSPKFYCEDRYVSESRDDQSFELLEVATGERKRLPVGKLDFPAHAEMIASRDGRWIAFGEAYRIGGSSGPGPLPEPTTRESFHKCEIWDWHNRKPVASLLRDGKRWGNPCTVIFSDDNHCVAFWHEGKEVRDLKFIHLDSLAEARVAFPAGFFAPKTPNQTQQSYSCSGHFSRNSAYFALYHSVNDGQRVAMIETKTGRVLWSKADWEFVCFGPDDTCLLDERDEQRNRNLRVADTKSGAILERIDANLHVYDDYNDGFDDSQRLIVLSSLGEQWRDPDPLAKWFQDYLPWTNLGKSPGLAVVDLATGRQQLGLLQSPPHFMLSGDGSTLATCRSCSEDNCGLTFWRVEIWDLRPHRALFRSATISVGLGILGLLLRRISNRKGAAHS